MPIKEIVACVLSIPSVHFEQSNDLHFSKSAFVKAAYLQPQEETKATRRGSIQHIVPSHGAISDCETSSPKSCGCDYRMYASEAIIPTRPS